MTYRADGNLLFEIVLERREQLEVFLLAVLHFERPHVAAAALQVNLDGVGVTGVLHHALHVGIAPAGVDPKLDVIEPLDLSIERVDHEFHFLVVLAVGVRHEMKRWLFDLNAPATAIAQRQQFFVHGLGHVPDDLALVLVLGRVNVEEERHHLRTASAKLDGLARLGLRDAPHFSVIQRPVLDLVHNMRPAPPGVNLVQQRAWRIVKPGCRGLLGLQVIALETGPALQRVMVPGASRHVLIHVKVAVRQDVEPGALLIADHHGHGILKLLAKAHVEHAGVERASPHTHVAPTWPRERTCGRTGENQIGSGGEHGCPPEAGIIPPPTMLGMPGERRIFRMGRREREGSEKSQNRTHASHKWA